jgi:hypothetical protein
MAKGISFGAKGGLFTASITTIPRGWQNTSFKLGYSGGVFVNYAIDKNISLQSEVLYVMKGTKGVIDYPDFHVDFTANYDYIDIPIFAKYTLIPTGSFRPFVLFGPTVGINLSADVDIEGQGFSGTIDYSKVTNTMELGIVFGAGAGIPAGRGLITLDGRFNMGLSKIIKGGEIVYDFEGQRFTESIPEEETKNIGFALLIGYAF